jgi:predicted  nucleic acid-binding Zn-ribbon protein
MDLIEMLLKLQAIDRERDALQRRLDQVPVRLKAHTDSIAAARAALQEQENLLRAVRAEADRNELEIRTKEAEREKVRRAMGQPKLHVREYTVLKEQLAGLLADIGSLTERGVACLERAQEAEEKLAELRVRLAEAEAAYRKARDELEGSFASVRTELEERTRARSEFAASIPRERLEVYERVRAGLKGPAMAAVEGTIDRSANRIGNDLHCSACFMAVTSNDAVRVLARKELVQCRSCMRILYVP